MNLEDIIDRRQRELGRKPESLLTKWLENIDWEQIMSVVCGIGLILGFVLYSASVLGPVLSR